MKSLIIIFMTLTNSVSLFVVSFPSHQRKFLNNDYILVNDLDAECLLFSTPLSAEAETSNSEDDSSPDDDEITSQFVAILFVHSGCIHFEQAENKLASISLGAPLLPPENRS